MRGFTIVELLVVIASVAVLLIIAVVSLVRSRAAAKEFVVHADIVAIQNAITLLIEDTGKWPNGCPPNGVSNSEVDINNTQAGIVNQPLVGDQGDGCEWTAEDVVAWGGPYIVNTLTDAWGNAYYFDPDYNAYAGCSSKTTQANTPVIVSFGPNGAGVNDYDCDDIFLLL